MWDVPPPMENDLDLQSVPGDSVADLRHKLIHDRPCHPGSILQGWVAVSTGQVSKGDCQLESWTQGVSHPGPLPLDLRAESLVQLLKDLGWHPDEVLVGHRVI